MKMLRKVIDCEVWKILWKMFNNSFFKQSCKLPFFILSKGVRPSEEALKMLMYLQKKPISQVGVLELPLPLYYKNELHHRGFLARILQGSTF